MSKYSKVKVVIDRAKWQTAGHAQEYDTHLLNLGGKMCCLGFVCKQLGATYDDLRDAPDPMALLTNVDFQRAVKLRPRLARLFGKNERALTHAAVTVYAIEINDHFTLKMSEREEKLIELFKSVNIELEFAGEYSGIISECKG